MIRVGMEAHFHSLNFKEICWYCSNGTQALRVDGALIGPLLCYLHDFFTPGLYVIRVRGPFSLCDNTKGPLI